MNTQKKEFIRILLKKYQMKRRECVWILNYLLSHETMLDRVHFVEDLGVNQGHQIPDDFIGMVMSTTVSGGVPFRLYFDRGKMTADAEKAFHKLRLSSKDQHFYLQLNFTNPMSMPEFVAAVESNPFSKEDEVTDVIRQEAIRLSDQVSQSSVVFSLEQAIDEAIDNNDKESFLEYSKQLVNLKKQSGGSEILRMAESYLQEASQRPTILSNEENKQLVKMIRPKDSGVIQTIAGYKAEKTISQIDELKQAIDEAIDQKDKQQFLILTTQLKELTR